MTIGRAPSRIFPATVLGKIVAGKPVSAMEQRPSARPTWTPPSGRVCDRCDRLDHEGPVKRSKTRANVPRIRDLSRHDV